MRHCHGLDYTIWKQVNHVDTVKEHSVLLELHTSFHTFDF